MTSADDDTRVDAPAARRRSTRTTGGRSTMFAALAPTVTTADGSANAASPIEALRLDEISRTRRLLPVVLGIVGAVAVSLPFLGGNPTAKLVMIGGIGLALAAVVWLRVLGRDPQTYTEARVAVAWTAISIGIITGVVYFGVHSPAPILMVLAIYLVSLGRSRPTALLVWAMCAAAQASTLILSGSGVIEDPGLLHAEYLSFNDRVIGQLLVQIVLVGTFVTARASRQAALQALEQLEHAVRGIAQREAMLQEARLDLDRALRVGGPGRFTGFKVGSFELGVVIGRGGMGEVYEASHAETGDVAAIKLLLPNVVDRPGYIDRFRREVDATEKVNSPHIVHVLEVGGSRDRLPYLAMERLRGHDLAYYLRTRRRLGAPKVLQLVREVGTGIEAAGNAGIVHRDIKPNNLFLHEPADGAPLWKILDFGVSKLGGGDGTLTQGRVVGTPGYMAPEQAESKDVDSRADLYALAAIAYRALTGHPPFPGNDAPTVLYNVVYKMPRRPSELAAELPPEVDDVLAIALAKNPDDRFFTAGEFASALADALDGKLDEQWRKQAATLGARHPWG